MQCTHENVVFKGGTPRRVCCGCGLTSDDGVSWRVTPPKVELPAPLMSSLGEANSVVNGERQDQYGSPENSFKIIAGYWNIFLRSKLGFTHPDILTPLDVVNMLVLFKQARKLGQKPKRDNYIDSIGYEAIGADRLWED